MNFISGLEHHIERNLTAGSAISYAVFVSSVVASVSHGMERATFWGLQRGGGDVSAAHGFPGDDGMPATVNITVPVDETDESLWSLVEWALFVISVANVRAPKRAIF